MLEANRRVYRSDLKREKPRWPINAAIRPCRLKITGASRPIDLQITPSKCPRTSQIADVYLKLPWPKRGKSFRKTRFVGFLNGICFSFCRNP